MATSVTLKKNKLGVKIKTYNRIHSLPNGDLKKQTGWIQKETRNPSNTNNRRVESQGRTQINLMLLTAENRERKRSQRDDGRKCWNASRVDSVGWEKTHNKFQKGEQACTMCQVTLEFSCMPHIKTPVLQSVGKYLKGAGAGIYRNDQQWKALA